jgi:hypothetical protein
VSKLSAELESAIKELVADGCTDDEALQALEKRFGWHGLLLRLKVQQRERDERARCEEHSGDL